MQKTKICGSCKNYFCVYGTREFEKQKYCSTICYNKSRMGKPTWNIGLTKDNDKRLKKLSMTIKKLYEEGFINGMLGKHHTEKLKKDNSKRMKILYKEGKITSNISEYIKKNGNQMLGHNRNGQICKKCGRNHGENPIKGKYHSEETIRKIKNKAIKRWQDEIYKEKYFKSLKLKPNKSELKLNSILQKHFPNEWLLNVKSKEVILGNKIPDFVNLNGKKICIEGFHDYWKIQGYGSVENYIKQRSEHFAKYGYKTIFINYEELKNEEAVIDKIKGILK